MGRIVAIGSVVAALFLFVFVLIALFVQSPSASTTLPVFESDSSASSVQSPASSDNPSVSTTGFAVSPNAPNEQSNTEGASASAGISTSLKTKSQSTSESQSVLSEASPNYCSPESRIVESCDEAVSHTVCGWYDTILVACNTFPCVHLFVNSCEACANSDIIYWTDNECPLH